MMDQGGGAHSPMPLSAGWLGGLGIIPFVAGAVLANIPETADIGRWVVIGYGAVILSFLGGIQWGAGMALRPGGALAYVVSVLVSLIGWAALLAGGMTGLIVLAAGFAAALTIDLIATAAAPLPAWFAGLRVLLTAAVLACIAASSLPLLL